MSDIWGPLVGASGVIGVIVAGLFTARATRAAAAATAEATRAAAHAAAEPEQRKADLESFREIRDDMQDKVAQMQMKNERMEAKNERMEARQSRLEALVRAFSRSADRWCAQMRRAGIDPEPPDPLVEEYHRTGV
ncbi:hypothetical protein [Embleya sp. NPDC001921]